MKQAADHAASENAGSALLAVEHVIKRFRSGGQFSRDQRTVTAVAGVSLTVAAGEVFCLVGESGCGKSTLAQLITGLQTPDAGAVYFDGARVDHLSAAARRPYRRVLQMIFQNPQASLNPRMTVRQTLAEALAFHFPDQSAAAREETMLTALRETGLEADALARFPHQFSGGQRQRISIARALIVQPRCIIADEPVAALDVSVRAQILNLLTDLGASHGLAYFFITHDLSVVENFGNRAAVMYLGTIVETATCRELFARPRHPYTQILLEAAPKIGKPLATAALPGEPPSPLSAPSGCPFHPRCPHADDRCRREKPQLIKFGNGDATQAVACHKVS